MKKWLSFFMICSCLSGCQNSLDIIYVKEALVLEVLEDRILVQPYDTISNEPVYFLVSKTTHVDQNIEVGNTISATIDNKFMMSYPGQVNAFEIKVVKK